MDKYWRKYTQRQESLREFLISCIVIGAVGGYLTSHPGIAKVSFTGQVSTGQKVAASARRGIAYADLKGRLWFDIPRL